jgi:hypothetical protein
MADPFRDLYAKSYPAFVSLAGVLIGLWAYPVGLWLWFSFGFALLLAWIALMDGRLQLARRPRRGRWEIEVWGAAPILVTSLATIAVIGAVLNIDITPLMRGQKLSLDQLKDLAGLAKGAVSGFIAFVFTKDIGEGTGVFAVATQFQAAMRTASGNLPVNPPPEDVIDAMSSDRAGGGIDGWGFVARGKRALRVSQYLKSLPRKPGP